MKSGLVNRPSRLNLIFNLREGEERTVLILITFCFLQTFALSLFFIAGSAIFLTEYPITSLPYVFLTSCGLLLTFEVLYRGLGKVLTGKQLLLAETIVLIVMMLMFRLGLMQGQWVWMGFALMAGHRVMGEIVSGGVIRLVLLLFDVRQSKRLFGLVNASEIPANLLGYTCAYFLVPLTGTGDLLWIALVSLIASFGFLFFLLAGKEQILDTEEEQTEPTPKPVKKNIFISDFVLALSLTSFLAMMALIFIEYSFLSQVSDQFSNQESIVFYLSVILGIGQVLAFFIHTFFYGRIQRRFGLKTALFMLPLILSLITLFGLTISFFKESAFFISGIWVVIMLVSDTLKTSLYNNTFMSLLQPLGKRIKLSGFTILGRFEIVAIGVTGLVLILLTRWNVHLLELSLVLIVILVAWLLSIQVLNKRYIQTLETVLKRRVVAGGVLHLDDPRTLKLLHEKLDSTFIGEAMYAFDILSKDKDENVANLLKKLLHHPLPEIRQEVYRRIERLKLADLQDLVKAGIEIETMPELKRLAIGAYCALGEAAVVEEVTPYLFNENKEIQTGAMVGLIQFGGINGIILGGQRLLGLTHSAQPHNRAFAAYIIGEIGIYSFYHPLLTLLEDDDATVVNEALKAAGKIMHPRLFGYMLKAVATPQIFEGAVNALIKTGDKAIEIFKNEFDKDGNSPTYIRRLAFVCGRVGSEKSIDLLRDKLSFKNIEIRNQILHSLMLCRYVAPAPEKGKILKTIRQELTDASWLLNAMDVFLSQPTDADRSYQLMANAIAIELHHLKKRVLLLLSFIYQPEDILQAWNVLEMRNKEKTANAFEILDVLISQDLGSVILPMLEDFPLSQQVKILNVRFPQKRHSAMEYLNFLIPGKDTPAVNSWTRALSIYAIAKLNGLFPEKEILEASQSPDRLVADTARHVLKGLQAQQTPINQTDMNTGLMPIEKVLALKTTEIFKETAEDILVEIAYIAREVHYQADELVFQKNDNGTCMFIIYSGSVKIHDSDLVLAKLKERDFFGELSLLDAEPRSATVTTLEDSTLLRIDQNLFYEIMADRSEVTREIMKILCKRLRSQNSQLARLNEQLGTARS